MTLVASVCGNTGGLVTRGQVRSPGVDLNRSELTKGTVSIDMPSVTQVASVCVNTGYVVTRGLVWRRGVELNRPELPKRGGGGYKEMSARVL